MRALRRIPLTRFGWTVVLAIPILLVVAALTGHGFIAGIAFAGVIFLVAVGIGPPRNIQGRFERYDDLGR